MVATHPDAAALLRAVCANPADDAPRLVYADWLDEQGDDASARRANYIRAMVKGRPDGILVRVAVEPDQYGHPEPVWQVRSKRPLCLFDCDQTIAMLPPPDECGQGVWVGVKRGFIERAGMSTEAWGVARRRLGGHLLRRVRLSERWPAHINGRFHWCMEGYVVYAEHGLPAELFWLLTGGHDDGTSRSYPTEAAAIDALSRACIRWARCAGTPRVA